MKQQTYKHGVDNIFDYHFMDDFTTVNAFVEDFLEKHNLPLNAIQENAHDDFYCLSEKKIYSEQSLFAKFNIKKI